MRSWLTNNISIIAGGVKSVTAGLATASILFAFMWWRLGSLVASGIDNSIDNLPVCLIFFDSLLPVTIAIFIVSGMAVGLVRAEEKSGKAILRAAIATYIFSGAVMTAVMILVPHEHKRTVSEQLGLVHQIILALLAMVMAAFAAPLAFFFYPFGWIAAIISAEAGDRLRRSMPHVSILLFLFGLAVAISLILFQSSIVQGTHQRFEPYLLKIEKTIDQQLVDLPNNPKWKKLTDRSFSLTINRLRCGERGNMVYVDLNEDGTMKSAGLRLMTPKGVVLADKEAVVDYLRKNGVREKLVSSIHKTKNDFWEAKHGNLSVTFSKYYPSYKEVNHGASD